MGDEDPPCWRSAVHIPDRCLHIRRNTRFDDRRTLIAGDDPQVAELPCDPEDAPRAPAAYFVDPRHVRDRARPGRCFFLLSATFALGWFRRPRPLCPHPLRRSVRIPRFLPGSLDSAFWSLLGAARGPGRASMSSPPGLKLLTPWGTEPRGPAGGGLAPIERLAADVAHHERIVLVIL